MVKRRSVLATLAAFVGGVFGLLGLGVAQISPWFDISRMIDIRDPVPLQVNNDEPVDHTVDVTITDVRSGATVFEETVDVEAATGEEMTSVEFEEVTSTVGEYHVTAELETGESDDYMLDPLDYDIFNMMMPDSIIVYIGPNNVQEGEMGIYVEGNPP